MKIEPRYNRDGNGKTVIQRVVLICESEEESRILDAVGVVGSEVSGFLKLSDGYGEFYLELPAGQTEITGDDRIVTGKSHVH